jgi:PAS domain S-box-containing protein
MNDTQTRLKAIIDNAIDGIITIDDRGIIETINPAGVNLFGYEQHEVVGRNINILMPEPYHSQHDTYMQNYHNTGQRKIIGIGREVSAKRKDGSVFPCFLSVSEVLLENKKIFTGIVHDITPLKLAESGLREYASKLEETNRSLQVLSKEHEKNLQRISELNQQLEERVDLRTRELAGAVRALELTNQSLENQIIENKEVEEELRKREQLLLEANAKANELNELKSRFISMASHEFRTPLSTVLSSLSLLNRYHQAGDEEKYTRHTQKIKAAVANLTELLDYFLSVEKLEEGKVQLEAEHFDLYIQMNDQINDMREIVKKGQSLVFQNDVSTLPVFMDHKIARTIVQNLLSNAIKYSEEGKTITITLSVNGSNANISVMDEGMGIPEDEQAKLFERFYRARNAGNIQGTGLGLNIIKKYIELMGGSITFESKLNKGTTFFVSLPINQA